jgi:pyocin large subunit-like protein
MSIFGKIVSAIFGHASAAAAPSAPGSPTAPAVPTATSRPAAAPAPSAPGNPTAPGAPTATSTPAAPPAVDVAAVLNKLAASNKEKLDWQRSIVDLMKLLNLDSSLAARKELADELHYSGDKNNSATMNIWLHKQVMQKLAENGGKVPEELRK